MDVRNKRAENRNTEEKYLKDRPSVFGVERIHSQSQEEQVDVTGAQLQSFASLIESFLPYFVISRVFKTQFHIQYFSCRFIRRDIELFPDP